MIHSFLLRQPKKHHHLYSVSEVANYVSAICNHDGIELHVKDLNAIIVKIHELFRYRSDHVLFYANFMRTEYGYDSPEVCNEFRRFGNNPIKGHFPYPYFDNEDARLIRFAIQEYFRS